MLHFKIENKTDTAIVEYFENLTKELLEGKLSWLLMNLSCPNRFLFPSYEQIRMRMSASKSTAEKLGFVNKIVDINGNNRNAGEGFDLRQSYDIWLMNILKNSVVNMILTAVNTKQLTYGKLKKWFLENTAQAQSLSARDKQIDDLISLLKTQLSEKEKTVARRGDAATSAAVG